MSTFRNFSCSPYDGIVVFTVLLASPVWTRYELLRRETRSARTTPVAFGSMLFPRNGASIQTGYPA